MNMTWTTPWEILGYCWAKNPGTPAGVFEQAKYLTTSFMSVNVVWCRAERRKVTSADSPGVTTLEMRYVPVEISEWPVADWSEES